MQSVAKSISMAIPDTHLSDETVNVLTDAMKQSHIHDDVVTKIIQKFTSDKLPPQRSFIITRVAKPLIHILS